MASEEEFETQQRLQALFDDLIPQDTESFLITTALSDEFTAGSKRSALIARLAEGERKSPGLVARRLKETLPTGSDELNEYLKQIKKSKDTKKAKPTKKAEAAPVRRTALPDEVRSALLDLPTETHKVLTTLVDSEGADSKTSQHRLELLKIRTRLSNGATLSDNPEAYPEERHIQQRLHLLLEHLERAIDSISELQFAGELLSESETVSLDHIKPAVSSTVREWRHERDAQRAASRRRLRRVDDLAREILHSTSD